MLIAGSADLTHQVRHALDRTHHFRHGGAGLVYQRRTLLHPFHAVVDQGLDLLGGLGRATSQAAHFAGHHGKATALLARAGGFHGSVQGQDVRLEGNTVDHANDVGDLARAVVDALHGFHHLAHYLTALHRHGRGAHCQLVGLAGVVGVLPHGRIELLHGRSRLLQGAGLLLCAGAQVVVARSDFRRGHRYALRAFTHMAHDAREAFLHLRQCAQQAGCLVLALSINAKRQVALADFFSSLHRTLHGGGDGTRGPHRKQQTQYQRGTSPDRQHPLTGLRRAQYRLFNCSQLVVGVLGDVFKRLDVVLGHGAEIAVHQGEHIFTGLFALEQLGTGIHIGFAGGGYFGQQFFALVAVNQGFEFFLLLAHLFGGGRHVGPQRRDIARISSLERCGGAGPVQINPGFPLHGQLVALNLHRGDANSGFLEHGQTPKAYCGNHGGDQKNKPKGHA